LACAKFDFIFDKSGALHEIMMSSCFAIASHLDNFYLKCVILLGSCFFFFNLLFEDLAEGQVFLKIFYTRKRQEIFGGYHHN
jgi:hypothetical protein